MVYTSNYKNYSGINGISISIDGGKDADFVGDIMSQLAPSKKIKRQWQRNVGKIGEAENLLLFISNYYMEVLSKLNPSHIYCMFKDNAVLLDYESPSEISIRHIVSAWLELYLPNKTIREIRVDENGKINKLPRNKYYAYIKGTLETIIKRHIDLHGYSSIAAAYLYESSLHLDKNPQLSEKFRINGEMYRKMANIIDSEYKSSKKIM